MNRRKSEEMKGKVWVQLDFGARRKEADVEWRGWGGGGGLRAWQALLVVPEQAVGADERTFYQ